MKPAYWLQWALGLRVGDALPYPPNDERMYLLFSGCSFFFEIYVNHIEGIISLLSR